MAFTNIIPSSMLLLSLMEIVTSKIAIWVYVGVLVLSVFLLVIAIVSNELKTPKVITKASNTNKSLSFFMFYLLKISRTIFS